jgi:radical SAM protein with 4Fe4S-binding SPASM domain
MTTVNRIFNSEVELFELGGIKILANPQNGSFVGLDFRGKEFVEKIFGNESFSQEYVEQNSELDSFLKDSNFYKNIISDIYVAAYIHLTNRCPLNCVGCYSEDSTRNNQNDLTTDQVFQELDELRKNGVQSLVISGGEPLLRKDIVDIVKYAKLRKHFEYVVILTSGMIFDQQLANDLAKFVDELSISIDGFSEKSPSFLRNPGIFNRVIKSIEIAKKAEFNILSVLPTLHKKNIEYVDEYAKFAKKYGVNLSYSILTIPPENILKDWIPTTTQLTTLGRNAINIKENITFSKEIKKNNVEDFSIQACNKCGIGTEIISLGSDGEVYPCHMCHNPKLSLGNIFDESLADIRMKSEKIIGNIDIKNNSTCMNCKYQIICGGGCRARAYMFTKSLNGYDPYCPMFRAFFEDFEKAIEDSFT